MLEEEEEGAQYAEKALFERRERGGGGSMSRSCPRIGGMDGADGEKEEDTEIIGDADKVATFVERDKRPSRAAVKASAYLRVSANGSVGRGGGGGGGGDLNTAVLLAMAAKVLGMGTGGGGGIQVKDVPRGRGSVLANPCRFLTFLLLIFF